MTTTIGSHQDGEDPNLRSDQLTERNQLGRHDGVASSGRTGRPKNREVENEMIAPPKREGVPPKAATEP